MQNMAHNLKLSDGSRLLIPGHETKQLKCIPENIFQYESIAILSHLLMIFNGLKTLE